MTFQNEGVQRVISALGGPWVRWPLVALLSLFLSIRQHWRQAGMLVVGVGGAAITSTAIKQVVGRARPRGVPSNRQASGYSFPSGHSAGSVVFCLLLPHILWDLTRRRAYVVPAGIVGVCVSVMIGRSRVWLRAHHRGDVLAGYGLGIFWFALVWRLFRRR
jgi:membrane-associated phospholipid phosphatase